MLDGANLALISDMDQDKYMFGSFERPLIIDVSSVMYSNIVGFLMLQFKLSFRFLVFTNRDHIEAYFKRLYIIALTFFFSFIDNDCSLYWHQLFIWLAPCYKLIKLLF